MSRNNLILVIAHRRRYYVVSDVNADVQWNEKFAQEHINDTSSRSTSDRGKGTYTCTQSSSSSKNRIRCMGNINTI